MRTKSSWCHEATGVMSNSLRRALRTRPSGRHPQPARGAKVRREHGPAGKDRHHRRRHDRLVCRDQRSQPSACLRQPATPARPVTRLRSLLQSAPRSSTSSVSSAIPTCKPLRRTAALLARQIRALEQSIAALSMRIRCGGTQPGFRSIKGVADRTVAASCRDAGDRHPVNKPSPNSPECAVARTRASTKADAPHAEAARRCRILFIVASWWRYEPTSSPSNSPQSAGKPPSHPHRPGHKLLVRLNAKARQVPNTRRRPLPCPLATGHTNSAAAAAGCGKRKTVLRFPLFHQPALDNPDSR